MVLAVALKTETAENIEQPGNYKCTLYTTRVALCIAILCTVQSERTFPVKKTEERITSMYMKDN